MNDIHYILLNYKKLGEELNKVHVPFTIEERDALGNTIRDIDMRPNAQRNDYNTKRLKKLLEEVGVGNTAEVKFYKNNQDYASVIDTFEYAPSEATAVANTAIKSVPSRTTLAGAETNNDLTTYDLYQMKLKEIADLENKRNSQKIMSQFSQYKNDKYEIIKLQDLLKEKETECEMWKKKADKITALRGVLSDGVVKFISKTANTSAPAIARTLSGFNVPIDEQSVREIVNGYTPERLQYQQTEQAENTADAPVQSVEKTEMISLISQLNDEDVKLLKIEIDKFLSAKYETKTI